MTFRLRKHFLVLGTAITATVFHLTACADDFWGEMKCPSPATGDARLYDARIAPSEDEPIVVESDDAEGDVVGAWSLHGNVEIQHGDRRLRAQEATYDSASKHVVVDGTVEYADPQLRLRGRDAQYAIDGAAEFANAEVFLPSRNVRGTAERIDVQAEGGRSKYRQYHDVPARQ